MWLDLFCRVLRVASDLAFVCSSSMCLVQAFEHLLRSRSCVLFWMRTQVWGLVVCLVLSRPSVRVAVDLTFAVEYEFVQPLQSSFESCSPGSQRELVQRWQIETRRANSLDCDALALCSGVWSIAAFVLRKCSSTRAATRSFVLGHTRRDAHRQRQFRHVDRHDGRGQHELLGRGSLSR